METAANESALSLTVFPYQVSGLFSFSIADISASEDVRFVEITVVRKHGADGSVLVTLQSEDGTAQGRTNLANATSNFSSPVPGNEKFDFVHINDLSIVFENGERTKTVYLEVLDDEIYETGFETLSVKIIAVIPADGSSTAAIGRQDRVEN